MLVTGYTETLTEREIEVLHLLAEGYSNQQIADSLNITVRTVKFHTANIYGKIDVNSRSAAIAWVWKYRVIPAVS